MDDSLFLQVDEREVGGEVFQVTHRLLVVPLDVYCQTVREGLNPFSEEAAQEFVERYLAWRGDKDGLLGMVRIDRQDGNVVLDAAIRYRINALDRPLVPCGSK